MKRCAKKIVSAELGDDLINWIRETPHLYQKGLRDYMGIQKRSRL